LPAGQCRRLSYHLAEMETDTAQKPTGWGDPPAARPPIDDIRAAARRIGGLVRRTELVPFRSDASILLKDETTQPTGSFKVRGVLNWAESLSTEERKRGFSTFSAGNTALALAFAAQRSGTTCRSLLPDYAPARKVDGLRKLGVDTVLVPFSQMADYIFTAGWRREPWTFLHPWTEPRMIEGHATIGLELLEAAPDTETIFVPVGGGALASGVASAAKALKPGLRVVGVQTESYPAVAASLAAGRPVWVETRPTICDGVAVPFATDSMFPLLRSLLDGVVLITEAQARDAIHRLYSENSIVSEGAGALALAAALITPPEKRGRTACLVTGRNIDEPLFVEITGG
jgi:threonine dehydratase